MCVRGSKHVSQIFKNNILSVRCQMNFVNQRTSWCVCACVCACVCVHVCVCVEGWWTDRIDETMAGFESGK